MGKRKVKIDWYLPWCVGVMFTLGYMIATVVPFWTEWHPLAQAATGVAIFLLWPLFLGFSLGGGF